MKDSLYVKEFLERYRDVKVSASSSAVRCFDWIDLINSFSVTQNRGNDVTTAVRCAGKQMRRK
jgi:hypothetical protein